MDSIRELGTVLRARRHELGLSQSELSERAGVSRPWLSRLEAGQHPRAEVQKVLDVIVALGLGIEVAIAPERSAQADDPFEHYFRVDR
ncbi:HTH-type transcriptional regulator/antitoxin HipB [Kineosphaera limosa]|uniref:Putative Xre family DNA-binding protein n=1 Tax=Kineosphaera limosa NBRC 100340 TaxID=1184609 RepID=K6WSQ0_9MICO|nr:HTH-type transcriptional regulator/antitoxin HipB [Kineosphaera limosa]GAB96836.1 putative Xre family DNA-binding protein [Kineosphaera limosa NBRC 100340]